MTKPENGTARSTAFVVEIATSWKRWAKNRSDEDLLEVKQRAEQLAQSFGKPHHHTGLGVRFIREDHYEFRISKGLRVIFLFARPRALRLVMVGNHDDVRTWIKEHL